MSALWWLAPATVAATVVIAGLAKLLRSRSPWHSEAEARRIADSLDLPDSAGWIWSIRFHPLVEIVVGTVAILAPSPGFTGLAFSVLAGLCGTYVAIAGRSLLRGASTCPCFGPLGSGRLTRLSQIRNLALTLGALLGVALGLSGQHLIGSAPWWVLPLAAALVGVALLTSARLVRRSNEPSAAEISGWLSEIGWPEDASAVLRLDLSPTCGPCRYLRRRAQETGADAVLQLNDVERPGADAPAPLLTLVGPTGPTRELSDPETIEAVLRHIGQRP